MEIIRASDQTFLINYGKTVTHEHHQNILALLSAFKSKKIPGVFHAQPAANSILFTFDPLKVDSHSIESELFELTSQLNSKSVINFKKVEIPVCYEESLGLDMTNVCRLHGVTPAKVIDLHANAQYQVLFLGFMPGFPYLFGLNKKLATPRLASPRVEVPEGSVAIGGFQAGIYPQKAPGGWNIIGRTPLKLFNPHRDPMTLLSPGDKVSFRPISLNTFQNWESL